MKEIKNIFQDIRTIYSQDAEEFNDMIFGFVGVTAIIASLYIVMIAVNS